MGRWRGRRPTPAELAAIVKELGWRRLVPPEPPPQETCRAGGASPRACGTPERRDAEAIHHHYDVSNEFYEMVLGPSMAYTCAVFPKSEARASRRRRRRSSTWSAASSASSPACGCSTSAAAGAAWSATPSRTTASHAVGVTLSGEQASVGAARRSSARASSATPRSCTATTATLPASEYDAVSSIGLLEHVGVRKYPAYFGFLHGKLRDGGRLLNHSHHPRAQRHQGHDRRLHRPLRVPRRRADRLRPHHHRGPGRRLRGPARGEPARALRADAQASGAPTWSPTGTPASPRSARARPGSGASTWPARGYGFETNEVQLHQVLGGQAGRGRRRRVPAAPHLVAPRRQEHGVSRYSTETMLRTRPLPTTQTAAATRNSPT